VVGGLAWAGGYGPTTKGGVSLASLREWIAPTRATVMTRTIKRGPLSISITEKGSLESSKNLDVACEVEGQTTIIEIKDEGTRVAKGDLVCELDSATLRDNLTNQVITTERAKADFENAVKTFEVAEINVQEYKEGVYPQELKTIQGEIKLAESEQTRAEDRVDWSNRMLKLGYVSAASNLADQLTLQRSVFSLSQAKKKLEVLERYTYNKTIKEREGEVEKARADKLAKEATFKLESDKEAKLRRMIEKCKLYAPNDGLVVYANEQNNFRGGQQGPMIERGAQVRERQKVFSIPDIEHMRVNAKVHESMIDKIEKGQSAKIRVDAFPNDRLTGAVDTVATMADQSSFFSSDIRVYTTMIEVNSGLPGLRPGMSAEVEILIAKLDDVMSVPVQAVLEFGGKQWVWVVKPDGSSEKRPITVGLSNNEYVEVKDGLKEGDKVALDPKSLMTESEKEEAFGGGGAATKGAGEEWSADDVAKSKAAGDGAPGKEKGKRKGGRGGPGGGGAIFQKMQSLSPEDQAKLRDSSTSEDDRKALLSKAGITDEEMKQLEQMREQMKAGGGPPGGGPGGGGGQGGGGGGPGGGQAP